MKKSSALSFVLGILLHMSVAVTMCFCPLGNEKIRCCPWCKMNPERNECIPCDTGFYGTNCEIRCPYPYFGHRCGSQCVCNVTYCDYVKGCIQSLGENQTYFNYKTVTTEEIQNKSNTKCARLIAGIKDMPPKRPLQYNRIRVHWVALPASKKCPHLYDCMHTSFCNAPPFFWL